MEIQRKKTIMRKMEAKERWILIILLYTIQIFNGDVSDV